MPEDRNDLCASHLHRLDVGGCDISVVLVAWVVGVLGVDADHWGLSGGGCEGLAGLIM